MSQKRTLAAVVMGTLLVTTGCGWLSSTRQGTVTGTITVSGGPAAPTGGPAFTGLPQQNGTVSFLANGQQIATTTTDSQGHYSVSVDPGTYSVDACGAAPASSGESVIVRAATTTQHDIVCSVP